MSLPIIVLPSTPLIGSTMAGFDVVNTIIMVLVLVFVGMCIRIRQYQDNDTL